MCQSEIEPGVWVNHMPMPFYYGILTKKYWKIRKQRIKDAKAVLNGEAIAVTWNPELGDLIPCEENDQGVMKNCSKIKFRFIKGEKNG